MEEWREIPEIPNYLASNLGNIRHVDKEQNRRPSGGQISISMNGEVHTFSQVRLVASAWLDIPLSHEVMLKYRDKDYSNLAVSNLYIDSLQLPDEVWEVIQECPDYSISNLGRVKRHKRIDIVKGGERIIPERILNVRESDEYYEVNLRSGTINIFRTIHRLVATAFISNPDNLPQVNHKDGNKHNNKVENLEWVSHLENQYHAINNGLWKNPEKGKRRPPVKVKLIETDEIFENMRIASESLNMSYNYLSERIRQGKSCHGLHFEILKEDDR